MELFFGVLLVILIIVVVLAGFAIPIGIWVLNESLYPMQKTLITVLGVMISAATIAFAISITPSDNARHCGTGTTYQESSHYNAATKTTQTDWWCARG